MKTSVNGGFNGSYGRVDYSLPICGDWSNVHGLDDYESGCRVARVREAVGLGSLTDPYDSIVVSNWETDGGPAL